VQDFRRLGVWQKSHLLALEVYRSTASFPKEERFGLTSQLRSCSLSVPTNIAEGCGRKGNRELAQFLNIAAGSAFETDYLLIFAHDIGYLHPADFFRLTELNTEVKRMLFSLIHSVESGA
jgi:four helix bundle protein